MIQEFAVLAPIFVSFQWALVLLLRGKAHNQARFWLGLFMLVAFSLYLGHAYYFMGWLNASLHYDPVYTCSSLMVFPMYYHYIRLLTVDAKWKQNYLLHYIPALVFGLAAYLLHRLYHEADHSKLEEEMNGSIASMMEAHHPFLIFYLAKRLLYGLQVIAYLYMGTRLIRNYHDRIRDFYSSMGERDIQWVSGLNFTLVFTAMISLIFNAIGRSYFAENPVMLLFPSALFSTLLFVIGYLGNAQSQPSADLETKISEEKAEIVEGKWGETELKEKLEKLFLHSKIYTNSELTIWDVAGKLNSNRTYISNLINEHYGMNFSRFVNRYRVEEAKTTLQHSDSWKLSLETIGEKCGFGSLNNFIRIFRSFEEITPGRYREQFLKSGKLSGEKG